ncbi:MAG: hypothetical protein LBU51_08050, partial [Bacteroidales bacterium]|nr:hypothetical protein [Bacteroidales bacterium]
MEKIYIFLVLLLFIPLFLEAQEDEENVDPCVQIIDKSAEKELKKALKLQNSGNKEQALKIYKELLAQNPNDLDLNYYYGIAYYFPVQNNGFNRKDSSSTRKALEAFSRIYAICSHYPKIQYALYAARLSYFAENFAEAVKFAKVLIDNQELVKNPTDFEEAETIIKRSGFFDKILNNPVLFQPITVQNISTKNHEYLATLSPDGKYFYFTRVQPLKDKNNPFSDSESKEFFCISKRLPDGNYEQGKPLPYPFNRTSNEGSPAINLNNDYLIFSKKTMVNSYPNYDLYSSEFIDGEWSEPKALGNNVNLPDSWESQPSLSSDGNILFFVSDRVAGKSTSPGKRGDSDIWYSRRQPDGSWGKAVNAGKTINTESDERSPCLHTDSKTLYFSSSGHQGLGGQDIFYSRINNEHQWTTPVNLGYPINSEKDEVNFFVSLDGKTGYFSSNNIENEIWNIYKFDLYEKARPTNMIIIKGKVEIEDDDFHNTVVELRDTTSKVISKTTVNPNSGEYALSTHIDENCPTDVIVNVKKEGHAFDTKIVHLSEAKHNVVTNNAEIKKVEKGSTYQLHDIYFATNLYSITEKTKHI